MSSFIEGGYATAIHPHERPRLQIFDRARAALPPRRPLRGHMAEFGFVAAQGLHNVAKLVTIVRDTRTSACRITAVSA